jgi:hypothetical protein
MTESFGQKVKGFLVNPSATFQTTRAETLSSAYQYFVMLLIIFCVLLAIVVSVSVSAILYYLGGIASTGLMGSHGASAMNAFTNFLVSYALFLPYLLFMLMLFGIFLTGFYYHVFVILFGGQKGLVQTVKTIMYAYTPYLLLGWIPFINIIGLVWTWILIIIGVRENQEMTTGKAVLVLIVPLILTFIFIVGWFAVVGSFFHALIAVLSAF